MPTRTSYRRKYRQRQSIQIVLVVICCVLALLLAGIFIWKGFFADNDTEKPSGDKDTQTEVSGDTQGEISSDEQEVVPDVSADFTLVEDADIHSGDLILVSNNAHFVFPENQKLVTVLEKKSPGSYYVRDYSILLTPTAFKQLDKLLVAFYEHSGKRVINVVAGHRTEEFQQHLFDQSAERNGLEHAQRYVSQPGGSEHHTGLALDLSLYFEDGTSADFIGTGEYQFIDDHAADYGFILRYPLEKEMVTGIGYESWHYRYVGYPHAQIIKEKGICLEEYIDELRQYTFENPLTFSGMGQDYQIYFCPEGALYVPKTGTYTISGNNVDGFIVTVTPEA